MNLLKKTLVVAAILLMSRVAIAADCCCPSCGEKACHVEAKTVKVKKHGYKVECKEICIPKFKFCWPWQAKSRSASACDGCTSADCTSCSSAAASCTDCARAGCSDGGCASCSDVARCGQVKTIRVLKRVEYECEKCGYEWKIFDVGCSDGGCDVPANSLRAPVEKAPEPAAAAVRITDLPSQTRTISFPY
jgi:hypothetical protein